MEFQIAFWISLVVLVGVLVYLVIVKKESNRYLTAYRPVKNERDKLKEENASLQKKLDAAQADVTSIKAERKANKKNMKVAAKVDDSAKDKDVSELEQKIAQQKSEMAKLKQENFDLRRENKDLLKDKQAHGEGNAESARMIVELRDARDQAKEALERANAKIADLEKEKTHAHQDKTEDKTAAAQAENDKRAEQLERDKTALEQQIQAVKRELSECKQAYRDKFEDAKKEWSRETKSLKDDQEKLKRQLQQSKTRADNNHRIFLIARAQMMLVEKRLARFDATYKPVALGTSSTAIDETIKKFLTHDLRESRASADVIERDRKINDLVAEIKTLKTQLSEAQNVSKATELSKAIEEDSKKSNSIENLVNALSDDLNIKSSNDLFSDFSFDSLMSSASSSDKNKDATILKGLDFSSLGDESWEAF